MVSDPRRRHWLQGAGAVALASALGACSEADAPVEPAAPTGRSWRMATSWAADLPGMAEAATDLAGAITRTSGGRLTVTAHPAGSLVEAFEVFDAVARGTVEMGHSAAHFWQARTAAAPFFCALPFGMTAQEMSAWLHAGGGLALWREAYAPHGVMPFAAGNTGMQLAAWSNREIRSLADLAGLKMRCPGLGGAVWARLGVATVNLPGAQVLEAMKQGQLDAVEWMGPWNDLAFGLPAVARLAYGPGWQEPGSTLECLVNAAAFNALPADLQAIVETCCRAANDTVLAQYTARNAQALRTLRERHRIEVRALPADVLAALRRAANEIVDATGASDPFVRRVRDAARAFQADVAQWHAVSEQRYLVARR